MLAAPKSIQRRSIHSARLERWLGKDKIAQLQGYMLHGGGRNVRWYGPPIYLADVPGGVWITPDGDFNGSFERGAFASALDHLGEHFRSLWNALGRPIYEPEPAFGVGFTSVSDVVAKASSGSRQLLNGTIQKTGFTGVVQAANTLWRASGSPAAGAAGAAAPNGTQHTSANTGAMVFNNPGTGTLHLTGGDMVSNVGQNALMLYDRIFSVAKTMNSTATESVTGVPLRYQSVTSTAMDYIGGNFLFIEVGSTALAATAHNWTVCTYTNQAGTAGKTLPSVTGNASAIADRFDQPLGTWFCPLASGDVGIKELDQMQCSALVATGSINFCIGHSIGIFAFPLANTTYPFDWITNRDPTPRIFNDACLALIELPKPQTTATTYSGLMYAVNAP